MRYHAFYVGPWFVEPGLFRISKAHRVVPLEPRAMEVLLCLAEHAGELVTKDELVEAVWGPAGATPDLLSRAISKLRKAFGDDAQRPAFIETIHNNGYRLIAAVSSGTAEAPPQPTLALPGADRPPAPASPSRRRMAPYLVGTALLTLLIGGLIGTWLSKPTAPRPLPATPLTTLPGRETNPELSPDGTQVAFAWTPPSANAADIHVAVTGSNATLQLTHHPADEESPTWSPDGRFIAFIRREEEQCGIYIIPALGGRAQRVARCYDISYPDLTWSPDGKWLAFNDRATPHEAHSLFLVSPETFETVKLTSPNADYWGDHDPAFAPDGETIAFTRSLSDGLQDLFLIPVAGGTPTRLTFEYRNMIGLDWAPDGQSIVFSSNRGGTFNLWRTSLQDHPGSLEWINISDPNVTRPDIAVQAGRLVYTRWTQDTNIWASRVDSSTRQLAPPVPVIASTAWDLHPHIAPDGERIAFSSNRSGTYEIWVATLDGTDARQLTAFNGPFTGTPRWAPDSQHLVFDTRLEGHSDLYVLDTGGGPPRRLTTTSSEDLAASWSQDGQWIYFSSNRGGNWNLWKLPSEGGVPLQITQNGGKTAFESPDGHFLYFTLHENAPGIWRMPTEGGAVTRVVASLDTRDWGSWGLVQEGLYFVQRGAGALPSLAFYDFATQRVQPLRYIDRDIPVLDPALGASQDGQWIFWGQIDREESDVILVERFR